MSLNLNDEIVKPHDEIHWVYFVDSGILSVVSNPLGDKPIEVGVIGFDGLSGVPVVMGCTSTPWRTFVQKAGTAHRIARKPFIEACEASASLKRVMLQYAHLFSIQVAETARSNGRFTVLQRLARWLLMAHDRTDSDDVSMTHEFLALMLGVRRPGVTVSLHLLEGDHLIRSRRGTVTVRDRAGLEAVANGSYGVPEAEYEHVFSVPIAKTTMRRAASIA